MNYFRLFSDVFLENGSVNSALYDLTGARLLPISPLESHILRQCERNIPVDQLQGAKSVQVVAFLEKLARNQLGQYYKIPVRIERYLPSLNIRINGLVEPPFFINAAYIQLTSECNLSCTDCGQDGLPIWQGCNTCERWPGIDRNVNWTQNQLDLVLDELLHFNIANVFFVGGNPLRQPDLLLHAVGRLRQKTPPVNAIIITNGAGATPPFLDEIATTGAKFYFVMLGNSPEEYGRVSGMEQGFADFVNGVTGCQQRGIPFAVSIVVRPETSSRLAERKKWAQQLGASHVFFAERITRSGDGAVFPLKVLAATGPARVKGVNAQQFYARREFNACLNHNIALAADRSVRPCPMIQGKDWGHLETASLRDIFMSRQHEAYWQLTKDAISDCRHCEFRYACIDCVAVDLQVDNHPTLRRSVCDYDPLAGEWRTA